MEDLTVVFSLKLHVSCNVQN